MWSDDLCVVDHSEVVQIALLQPICRHDWKRKPGLHFKGTLVSTYDADTLAELKHPQFRSQQQRYNERTALPGKQSIIPAIKMAIGDWYVDELGIWTREIRARD
jgi:hypothetical protein